MKRSIHPFTHSPIHLLTYSPTDPFFLFAASGCPFSLPLLVAASGCRFARPNLSKVEYHLIEANRGIEKFGFSMFTAHRREFTLRLRRAVNLP
jgi:hypothetical protein